MGSVPGAQKMAPIFGCRQSRQKALFSKGRRPCCVYAFVVFNSASNGTLDASVAAHIAENGSNRVFLRFFLMNALVCMQAKKRRLHAVPRCGSDRLNLHFREGSVAGISHIRKAYAPRKP